MSKYIGKIGNILTYVVLYILVYLLVLLIGATPAARFEWLQGWIGPFAMFCAGGIVFFLLPDKRELLKKSEKPVATGLSVVFLAAGVCVGLNFLMGLVPWDKISGSNIVQNNEVMFGIPFYVRLFAYVLVAPLSEEILFRGIIFRKAKTLMPAWAAIIISAAVFGLYHGNLQQGIYAFLCGCIIAWVYEMSDSFLMTVLFHATANLIVNLAVEFEIIRSIVYSIPALSVLIVLAVFSAILICFIKKNNKNREKQEQMF